MRQYRGVGQGRHRLSSLDAWTWSTLTSLSTLVCSHEKLLGLHNTLRKERDELWAENERLRSEASTVQHERDEMAVKLSTLRGEVKHSMDDVVQDR